MKTLIFDVETTALRLPRLANPDKQPYIIEFYGMIVDKTTWEVVDELELLIDPPVEIDAKITQLTGIAKRQKDIDDGLKGATRTIEGAPKFSDVAVQIKEFIESADLAVAHNMSFDYDMVNGEMERSRETVNWPLVLCTVEQTQHMFGYRSKLGDLYEHLFGERFKEAHTAKADVQALYRCYQELVERGEI